MKQASDRAKHEVASWVPPIARVGYAAKGIVYLLVGWIAIKSAMASASPEGSSGALASLADEEGGRLMLMLIALGLLAHVIWRAVQAMLDPEQQGSDAKRIGVRLFHALSGLIYASLTWLAAGGGGHWAIGLWRTSVCQGDVSADRAADLTGFIPKKSVPKWRRSIFP